MACLATFIDPDKNNGALCGPLFSNNPVNGAKLFSPTYIEIFPYNYPLLFF
jgi:hypothetical protein